MTKKIICLLIAMSLVLGSLPVFASSTDTVKPKFTRNTVITESNLNDVLASVGLDPTTCAGGKIGSVGITTVGQLQDELEKAKKMPKEVKINKTVDNNGSITIVNNGFTTITPLTITTGSTFLTDNFALSSITTIINTAWGDYSKDSSTGSKVWTGVRSPNVSVSNLSGPLIVSGYTLQHVWSNTASYTSSKITLEYDIQVDYYIIVLGLYYYPGDPQRITSSSEFSTSYIP